MYIAKLREELQELKSSMALMFCSLMFVIQLCLKRPNYVHIHMIHT